MSAETEQRTLSGDTADRVSCEYYDGCEAPARYGDDILHYGDGMQFVRLCESCADERRENPTHNVRRLKPADRFEDDDRFTTTVHIVVTNYADDPHPHVELVTTDESEAESLMDDCRNVARSPNPIAWEHYTREVKE